MWCTYILILTTQLRWLHPYRCQPVAVWSRIATCTQDPHPLSCTSAIHSSSYSTRRTECRAPFPSYDTYCFAFWFPTVPWSYRRVAWQAVCRDDLPSATLLAKNMLSCKSSHVLPAGARPLCERVIWGDNEKNMETTIILGLAAGAGNAAAKHLARVACQDRSPKRPRPNGVPIVQQMFLYEARARARLVQEHQLHNWEPIRA